MMQQRRHILITGGAGFIGTNLARHYLREGFPVHLFDNLCRCGVNENILDLRAEFGSRFLFTEADVRDRAELESAVSGASAIYHLAAQVAVTTSLEDPLGDLAANLLGTVNLLEAIRHSPAQPPLLFTSTNKVYGHLACVPLSEGPARYEPSDPAIAAAGAGENQPLEFLSPYGCSKGAADQYVLDYAHSFGIRAVVFRMSCIYGPHQLGSEDQGWVAHFLRQALKGAPVTIYGDGKQVRDLLFVEDLVRAMRLAHENMAVASGHAFNLGGGVANSTSLLDLIGQIENLTGSPVAIDWGPARLADQKWYVADTSKIRETLGWLPQVSIAQGLRALADWYAQHPALIARAQTAPSEVQVA